MPSSGPDIVTALTVPQVLDAVAVRIDGPRAWDEHITIAWYITDEDATYLTELRHGALHHRTVATAPEGVTVFSLDRLSLIGLVTGTLDAGAAIAEGKVTIDGDATVMLTLVGLMAEPDPAFNIVTP